MEATIQSEPTLTSEDIGRRVIKLVQNLRTLDQINPANLERQMGVKVIFDENNPNAYGFGGPIESAWRYRLFTIPDKRGETPTRLDFLIRDTSADGKADMAPVCTLSFHDYRDAFVAAGYSVKRIVIGRNNDPWRFTRGDVTVTAWMLRFVDPEKARACIGAMNIEF